MKQAYSVQILSEHGYRWIDVSGSSPEEAGRAAIKDAADGGWSPVTVNVYPLGTSTSLYAPIHQIVMG